MKDISGTSGFGFDDVDFLHPSFLYTLYFLKICLVLYLLFSLIHFFSKKTEGQNDFQESHVGNDVRFVNHLLLDFVRLHEVDGVSAVKGARTCRACKSEQLAMAVCKQCASDLCKNCYQAHRDMKLFDGHTV